MTFQHTVIVLVALALLEYQGYYLHDKKMNYVQMAALAIRRQTAWFRQQQVCLPQLFLYSTSHMHMREFFETKLSIWQSSPLFSRCVRGYRTKTNYSI